MLQLIDPARASVLQRSGGDTVDGPVMSAVKGISFIAPPLIKFLEGVMFNNRVRSQTED